MYHTKTRSAVTLHPEPSCVSTVLRTRRPLTPISRSRTQHREWGVWRRRFCEHRIRDERELYADRDSIPLNPVKHGY
ncbi:MAG: hypothetical protein D6744_09650, partial [Planctomycetota bacterium]